jgi:hypothetical protein
MSQEQKKIVYSFVVFLLIVMFIFLFIFLNPLGLISFNSNKSFKASEKDSVTNYYLNRSNSDSLKQCTTCYVTKEEEVSEEEILSKINDLKRQRASLIRAGLQFKKNSKEKDSIFTSKQDSFLIVFKQKMISAKEYRQKVNGLQNVRINNNLENIKYFQENLKKINSVEILIKKNQLLLN